LLVESDDSCVFSPWSYNEAVLVNQRRFTYQPGGIFPSEVLEDVSLPGKGPVRCLDRCQVAVFRQGIDKVTIYSWGAAWSIPSTMLSTSPNLADPQLLSMIPMQAKKDAAAILCALHENQICLSGYSPVSSA
jgi:hypothetical protein